MSFDGNKDYVLVGDKSELEQQEFTLSFWAQLDNPSGSTQGGIAKGWIFGSAAEYSYRLDFHNGNARPSITNTSNTSFIISGSIGDTDWHMWSMTAGGGTLTLYKDGAFVNSAGYTGTIGYTKSNNDFVIGARDNGTYAFDGIIDDVRFYNRVLSDEEIWQVYQPDLGPKASNPNPFDKSVVVTTNTVLSWSSGKDANSHDVYFGTDFNDVNDANRSNPLGVLVGQDHSTTTYDPPGFLELNTTYHWRIDEVNEPNIWKGTVWSFTILPYFVEEDFDSYADNNSLRDVWDNGSSSAEVSSETAIAVDGNSMKYQYKNDQAPYYSEVYADIADLGIGNPDWSGIGAEALVLRFYGDSTNPVGEEMYVKLTDGDISPGTGTVAYSNMKDVRAQQWNTWSIPLTEFNGVNLANVAGITIGFGFGYGHTGNAGTVYFDEIGGSSTSVSPTSLSIAAEASSTGTFTITSDRSWTVSNSQYWLTVNPTLGSGNGTVTVTGAQNGSLSRTGKLTVSVTGDSSQTVTVTQSGTGGECNLPPIPSFSSLVNNKKFPDPFTFWDGSCMNEDEWACRRAEIAELVQEFELGYKQETPYSATTGSMNGNTLTVTVNDNGTQISFNCSIIYPSTGSAPYPAMIGCGFSWLNNTALSNMGVAVIIFPTDEIAEQKDASSQGKGKFYNMYGSNHSAGALMAWAWGMDRLIDALEKTPAANIDPERLGVTGCSRWGKGALICGAFDERIKLTIPQESGAGGAASWRVSQYQRNVLGQNVQWLAQIVGENCWFRANFGQFGSAVNKLPFDHHMVAGLCAPRALLIIENTSMEWLGNLSTWTNGNVAHYIWEALGVPEKMGYSQVGGHNHCALPSSQEPIVAAYVQKFLVGGGTGNTNVMYTDGGFTFDQARWVDWAVPNLVKGDFNHDCWVGYSDLGLFVERWLGEDCLYNGWCYGADLNYDGGVDFSDYAKLAVNWLEGD